jgi:hypothetical protein
MVDHQQEAKQETMARVDEAANEEWKAVVDRCIE